MASYPAAPATPLPAYPDQIRGQGLVLRPWDERLVRQLAAWGERGFPFAAFDLGYLHDPERAASTLASLRESATHQHFIACEGDVAVGRCSVNLRDDAGIYIWAVHVPPEHAGRGVARTMLRALIGWLEETQPPRDFVLSANSFASNAHRVYYSLGFAVAETRWQHDLTLSDQLWRVPPEVREPLMPHFRHHNGHWEVRTLVMRRPNPSRQPAA